MTKEKKYIYGNVNFEFDKDYDSELFLKVRMKVMHDFENPNQSFFKKESMIKAENSISNKPILGRIIKKQDSDENDFNGHDVNMTIEQGEDGLEVKYEYLEKIIGIIPETNNYIVEYDEELEKNYVYVDGYIYKGYSNGADEIFIRDGEKKISMEILVDKGHYDEDNGYYIIEEYRYTAVTVLGDHLGTGMIGAKAVVKYEKTNEIYEKMLYQLNSELNGKKDKEQLNKNDSENFTSDNKKDVKINNEKLENKKSNFKEGSSNMLSIEQVKEAIFDLLNPRDEDGYRNYSGWIVATYPETKEIIVNYENDANANYKKHIYSVTEEGVVSLDEGVIIYAEFLTKEEKDTLEEMRKEFELLKSSNEDFKSQNETLISEKEALVSEKDEITKKFNEAIASLEVYQTKEKEEKVESLISEFTATKKFSDEEIEVFKTKALEITAEELEKELIFALGLKNREGIKFSAQTKEKEEAVKTVATQNFESEGKEFPYDKKYAHLFK